MLSLYRVVNADEWQLSQALTSRRSRLLSGVDPSLLIALVRSESEIALRRGSIKLQWQESDESPGYFRFVAQVPLTEETFDQFLNGRSGYRAQYYLSPEEGILFNHATLRALSPGLMHAWRRTGIAVDSKLAKLSLHGPHSKIWVFEDKDAFDSADPDALNPPRWVASGKGRGCRAPLPAHRKIDVKGAFIHPTSLDLFIDECKVDRACDLFCSGFT